MTQLSERMVRPPPPALRGAAAVPGELFAASQGEEGIDVDRLPGRQQARREPDEHDNRGDHAKRQWIGHRNARRLADQHARESIGAVSLITLPAATRRRPVRSTIRKILWVAPPPPASSDDK